MIKSTLSRIKAFTKPYSYLFVWILITALISIVLTLYFPILVGEAVDNIIGVGDVNFSNILKILLSMCGVVTVNAMCQWLLSHFTNLVGYRTARDIRKAVFNKINRVPLKTIDNSSHGDIINRVLNDTDYVAEGLVQGISQLFTGVFTILGTLIFMLTIDLVITAVVVCLTPLSLFVASFITRRSYNTFRRQSELQGELSGYVEEMFGNQRIVKIFGFEQKAFQRFSEINDRLYTQGFMAQIYSSFANPSTRFVNSIVYASTAIIGAISNLGGGITIGAISALLTYANQYTKPFNEITGIVSQIQTAFSAAQRLFLLLDRQNEPCHHLDSVTVNSSEGNVEINNVSFSYTPEKKLIEDLNLSAKKGNRIAIVGPTGSGKTTLINLLMRFYDVNSGNITLDGRDIALITRNSLRERYGMVLQDTWLFAGTIRDNIAYGNPAATEQDIIAAATAAHAHGFIRRSPGGYDTIITEDGSNLSSGQRQLICIARIMLTRPDMLILDEATSNIDTLTEQQIQSSFLAMMEGHTSFVVAHRLSTIQGADMILVMNKGRIVEQGTHKQLLEEKNYYYRLYSEINENE